jgi:hypothetical protein
LRLAAVSRGMISSDSLSNQVAEDLLLGIGQKPLSDAGGRRRMQMGAKRLPDYLFED